ncbi:MEKHLA domain-containing protein [Phyllobacterium phragmitis]|uniref:MEKHLA domain-containing protein n=1 Tax=Phyllobacterium phragmitis TaxID=2670329 RepID=A0A2S9IWH0_9HYPH|nr:MEKHLA domain-containing protein [Phyllobacterium phragmitis]PRD44872.1 MEKHLA domain-containing protein [Phyllobacterium phragmitis]
MNKATDPDFFSLLSNSYFGLTKKPLVPGQQDARTAARWLYEDAPFALLAHNTDADPCFIYANKTAQACFEYSWDEFTALPSRFSAEMPDREERQRLLDTAARDGYISDYRGIRVAKSGRRFHVDNVTLWQLIDGQGKLHGQAALIPDWRNV